MKKNIMVINRNGATVDFAAAVELMDNQIRERVHMALAPCTPQEFFSAYEQEYIAENGAEWCLSTENPVY